MLAMGPLRGMPWGVALFLVYALAILAGIGLFSMRERAEELGGLLSLATGSSGHGTCLTARLPLPAQDIGNP